MHSDTDANFPIRTRFDEAKENVGLFCSILKSLDNFNEAEIKGVIMGVLAPTLPEECLITTFFRASSNVKTLLELQDLKHFQAIGMLARSLFELAVDIKLMEVDPSAALKMTHFKDVEKLRACRSMVAFRVANGGVYTKDTQVQEAFIEKEEERIESVALTIWPGKPLRKVKHWSGTDLPIRVKMLDLELQEMYACFYRQLSWNVHAGLQGVAGLKAETFADLCGISYDLSRRVYEMILKSMIRGFGLDKHDPLIENKLGYARYLPQTGNTTNEAALRHDLGL